MGNIIGETIGQRYFKVMSCLGSKWKLANNILYRMCEDYPRHNNPDEIVAKIWLIGRSYAAAIERRRIEEGDEYDKEYYQFVRKMLVLKKEIEDEIGHNITPRELDSFVLNQNQ